MTTDRRTPCRQCGYRTRSIRHGRVDHRCENCGHNKFLSDLFYFEATAR